MKKTFLWLQLICLPVLIYSQGIKWTEGLTWEQVKQKAKNDRKYIFVDAYATWCAPCKKMDKEIYVDSIVGSIVNEKFVAVKVQMDSTDHDNELVKQWYPVVHQFNQKFKIGGYPSFLFFSSNGELLHQDLGYKNVSEFISLVKDASNPAFQDAKVMEAYKNGNHEPQMLLRAARWAKKNGRKMLADSIAWQYKLEFMDALTDEELFTQANMQFVFEFPSVAYDEGSKGRLFQYIYNYPEWLDSLFSKGYSNQYITVIIASEELWKKLIVNKKAITEEPNWDSLRTVIASKYTAKLAKQIIETNEPVFYSYTGNWKKYASLFNEKVVANKNKIKRETKYLSDFGDAWTLNGEAWGLFKVSNDRKLLKTALDWVKIAIKLQGENDGVDQYYDTKANLLYRLGKRREAIKLEQKALKLTNDFAAKRGLKKSSNADEFRSTLEKMKANLPTWDTSK